MKKYNMKLWALAVTILITAIGSVSSDELTPKSLTPVFTKIEGTPRVTRSETDGAWVVSWRQGSPGKIFGRTFRASGALGPNKLLATGITSTGNNFDFASDPFNLRYLLAFETPRGLEVQLLNNLLTKQGLPLVIETGASNTRARIIYQSATNQYLVFWLGAQGTTSGKILKVQILDSSGRTVSAPRVLAQTAAGKSLDSLSVARNPKNGNVILMMTELTAGAIGSVIGYIAKPDGALLKPQPLLFQAPTSGLNTRPAAAFDNDGAAFVFWSDRNFVKYRKLTVSGGFASAVKTITRPQAVNSLQIGSGFDSKSKQFMAAWSEGKELKSVKLNQTTGALIEQPANLANSILSYSRNIALSFSAQEGKFLAVWEDVSQTTTAAAASEEKFQIRAGVIGASGGSSETVINTNDSMRFSPASVTIRAGSTVKWVNSTSNIHTVTSGEIGGTNVGTVFDQVLAPTLSFTFRFTTPGTYRYFCRPHGSMGMTGTVIVSP